MSESWVTSAGCSTSVSTKLALDTGEVCPNAGVDGLSRIWKPMADHTFIHVRLWRDEHGLLERALLKPLFRRNAECANPRGGFLTLLLGFNAAAV